MQLSNILNKPIITEKSIREAKKGKYTFGVSLAATKTDIKKAVEELWAVKVVSVETMVMPGKTGRRNKKGIRSQKADWKKAIIGLASGQKLDLDYGA